MRKCNQHPPIHVWFCGALIKKQSVECRIVAGHTVRDISNIAMLKLKEGKAQ